VTDYLKEPLGGALLLWRDAKFFLPLLFKQRNFWSVGCR